MARKILAINSRLSLSSFTVIFDTGSASEHCYHENIKEVIGKTSCEKDEIFICDKSEKIRGEKCEILF